MSVTVSLNKQIIINKRMDRQYIMAINEVRESNIFTFYDVLFRNISTRTLSRQVIKINFR